MNMFWNSPGWSFTPDDEQLIKLHLTRKVRGFPMLCDVFAEKDLYGVDAPPPWEMFNDIDDDPPSTYYLTETNKELTITRKTVYVFTKLKAAASPANSKKGVRVSRRSGGGTWSGKSKPKKIVDSVTGDVIGHTKQLAFEREGVDEQAVGHWIMHEYSLTAGWGSDFVVCKITRCTTHPAPPPPPPPPIVEEYYEDFEDIFLDEEEIAAILREPAAASKKQTITSDEFEFESEKILMEEHSDDHAAYARELEEMLQEHGEDREEFATILSSEPEAKKQTITSDHESEKISEEHSDIYAKESEEMLQEHHGEDHKGRSFSFAEEFAATLLLLSEPEAKKQKTSDGSEMILEHSDANNKLYAKELEEMLQKHGEDKGRSASFAGDSWNWGGDKVCSFAENTWNLPVPDYAEEDIQKMMMTYQLMI